mmetsp:Transcript_8842/g.20460  ORF Transcript_8842/g.20460 Transcript_8842/m.20460 type:complete len:111 (-) Transcript_8842:148-480(-)
MLDVGVVKSFSRKIDEHRDSWSDPAGDICIGIKMILPCEWSSHELLTVRTCVVWPIRITRYSNLLNHFRQPRPTRCGTKGLTRQKTRAETTINHGRRGETKAQIGKIATE